MPNTVEINWLQHRWLVNHGCFELLLESLEKIVQLQIWDNVGWFSVLY